MMTCLPTPVRTEKVALQHTTPRDYAEKVALQRDQAPQGRQRTATDEQQRRYRLGLDSNPQPEQGQLRLQRLNPVHAVGPRAGD